MRSIFKCIFIDLALDSGIPVSFDAFDIFDTTVLCKTQSLDWKLFAHFVPLNFDLNRPKMPQKQQNIKLHETILCSSACNWHKHTTKSEPNYVYLFLVSMIFRLSNLLREIECEMHNDRLSGRCYSNKFLAIDSNGHMLFSWITLSNALSPKTTLGFFAFFLSQSFLLRSVRTTKKFNLTQFIYEHNLTDEGRNTNWQTFVRANRMLYVLCRWRTNEHWYIWKRLGDVCVHAQHRDQHSKRERAHKRRRTAQKHPARHGERERTSARSTVIILCECGSDGDGYCWIVLHCIQFRVIAIVIDTAMLHYLIQPMTYIIILFLFSQMKLRISKKRWIQLNRSHN